MVLRAPNVRRFFIGYLTSNVGTAMSATALAFAVLDSGHGASGLGVQVAAGIGAGSAAGARELLPARARS
jgi:hypothetical protein